MRGDEGLASAGVGAARLEAGGGGFEAEDDGVERGEVGRRGGDGADDEGLELLGAREEHLALVGEVAKERALGEAGAGGDVADGGVVVAALVEQLQGGVLQALVRVGFQRPMAASVADDER